MVVNIILIVLLLAAVVLIYAAFKTPAMKIERELVISAQPEKLFPYLNHMQKMNDWMPWQDSDPTAKMNYVGYLEGIGAKATWDSPGKMGTGESEIVESVPCQFVKTRLTYSRPMKMSQMAQVTLAQINSEETLVKWSVDGHNSFAFRLFGAFVNVDKMVGSEFEKGLLKLKKIAENVG